MSQEATIEKRKYHVVAMHDEGASDPREEYDHVGTLCLFHRRMDLANEGGVGVEQTAKVGKRIETLGGVTLPVFMYQHSGVALSTSPFSCPWDSGQVGIIYVSADTIEKEYSGVKFADAAKRREHVINVLQAEVAEYGAWLNGEVYVVRTVDSETNETIECVCNVYGDETEVLQVADEQMSTQWEYDGTLHWR